MILNNTNDSVVANVSYDSNPYFFTPQATLMNAKIGENVILNCFVTNNQKSKVAVSNNCD